MTVERVMPENAPQPGTYQHYKGPMYQVFGMARHSETDEWMVVYQALYGDYGFWLRPLTVWLEPLAKQHEAKKRFTLVELSDDTLNQLTKNNSAADE